MDPPTDFTATKLSDPEDEQEGFRQLAQLFTIVDGWQTEQRNELSPGQGSALAGDDRWTHDYEVSHAVQYLLGVAVDHLHCLRMVVQTPQSFQLHLHAPFTLNRAAIEAAATVVWLIAPASRDERIRRRLKLATQNARDFDSIAVLVGGPSTLDDRYEKIRDVARGRANIDPTGVVGTPPSMKQIINDAGAACAVGAKAALGAWMACSGIAHGRTWAGINLHDREELKRVRDIAGVHMTASAGTVALMTSISVLFVAEARRLSMERASRK
ncbi:MAG TPA: hypothetical protein VIQ02_04555 [Jiangellaceae bacterium]